MSVPNPEFTPPTLAGNHADDDPQVLDSLVQQAAEPPKPDALPTERPDPIMPEPPPVTRLLTGMMNIQKAWNAPTLLLPADPRRKSLRLILSSTTATDYVRVSDEQNKVQSVSGSLIVPVYGGGVDLGAHTGPVWVYAPDISSVATISHVAVTE